MIILQILVSAWVVVMIAASVSTMLSIRASASRLQAGQRPTSWAERRPAWSERMWSRKFPGQPMPDDLDEYVDAMMPRWTPGDGVDR